MRFNKKRQAFTLLELLAAVAVVGILAAVAFPTYMNYKVRANIAKVVNISTPYKQAVEVYYQLRGTAPTTAAQLNFTGIGNTIDNNSGQLPISTILQKIVFSASGSNPTINFYIPVANIGLSTVGGVSTIILTYSLANNSTTNLLEWTCTFSQGHAEFTNFIPSGCT